MSNRENICLSGNNSTLQSASTSRNEAKLICTSNFLGREINVYGSVDNPYFFAKDVAEWLELSNVSDMISRIDEEERSKFNLGRQGEGWFLSEDGLYEVFMQSRKPIAKQFKKGIKEILKSIRRTGKFSQKTLSPIEMQLEMMKSMQLQLQELIETKAEIKQLKSEVEEIKQRTTTDLHRSTIVAYVTRNHIKLDVTKFGAMGRKATSLCKKRGIKVTKINDVRWGQVSVYPDGVLEEVFYGKE